jgi:enoyl-CoA hydratase
MVKERRMASPVGLTLHDGVATLSLDDGKANALSLDMAQAIDAALDRALDPAPGGARAVVIRGRPGVLCGGFDLKVIRGGSQADRAAMTSAGYRLLSRLYLLPVPLVFACTGHAVAAGGLLLLTGDVRVGMAGAFRIGLNETAIGLSLPQIGLELARERIAPAKLAEATLGARLYDPEGAVAAGYLDRVAEDLDAAVAEALAALGGLDVAAYAATKRRLRQGAMERAVLE